MDSYVRFLETLICSAQNYYTGAYSDLRQISKLKLFAKSVNGFQRLNVIAKSSISDVWMSSECAFVTYCILVTWSIQKTTQITRHSRLRKMSHKHKTCTFTFSKNRRKNVLLGSIHVELKTHTDEFILSEPTDNFVSRMKFVLRSTSF